MTATSKPIAHRDGCTARPNRLRELATRIVCVECGRYKPRTDLPDTPCIDCGQPCRPDQKRCTPCFRALQAATMPTLAPAPAPVAPTRAATPTQARLVCRVCYEPVNRKGVCRAC